MPVATIQTRRVVWWAGVTGSKRPAADVVAALDGWCPEDLSDIDRAILEPLLPQLREHVLAAGPADAQDARRMLRPLAHMALWAVKTTGSADIDTLSSRRNIDYWTLTVNDGRSVGWRSTTRWVLYRVGRAVNAREFEPVAKVGRPPGVADPYDERIESSYKLEARLAGRSNRTAREAVLGLAVGAGYRGPEIAAAETSDLVELDDGRIALDVRGRHPRRVPVRAGYTDIVRSAVAGAGSGRLIAPGHDNAVHHVCERLAPHGGEAFSLPRARSTWLAAHLAAGTPDWAIRKVAGPVSFTTLEHLSKLVAPKRTADDAVQAALGA